MLFGEPYISLNYIALLLIAKLNETSTSCLKVSGGITT